MKDAYYFPHDCNAIQDPKMMTLLAECGAAGVGIFWILIEILHQQQCGGIGVAQVRSYISFYGKQGSWNQAMLDRCEKVLYETGLLFQEDGMAYSSRVINNLKKRHELSEIGKKNANSRWQPNAIAMQLHSKPNAIKERKGKESKGKTTTGSQDTASTSDLTHPKQEKPLTPVQKVVVFYKEASGVASEDKAWDRQYFPRFSASAKALLDFFSNDMAQIESCIKDVVGKIDQLGRSHTMETVVKHMQNWRSGKFSEKEDKSWMNSDSEAIQEKLKKMESESKS